MFIVTWQAAGWCQWCGSLGRGSLMMLAWFALLVVLVVLVWAVAPIGGLLGRSSRDRAEALLRERFARGEIDEATYLRMLDELRR